MTARSCIGVGANDPAQRELDNVVLERASFVCTDAREQAREEAGDLIEPVARGALDWLEVHELHDVVVGDATGRSGDDEIVVFKSNGLAAWDIAVAATVVSAISRCASRASEIRSSPSSCTTSGRSSRRFTCSGVMRFVT